MTLTFLTSALSFGAIIYDSGSLSLTTSSLVQKGRLSRSGTPSDWSSQKAFPGVLNPATNYRYATFLLPVSVFPYLQISFYDESNATNVFASAYLTFYSPSGLGINAGLDANYLGDAGSSGNPFGNPNSFQIVVPDVVTSRIVFVVNDASASGAGVGQPFDFLVEGFYDTNFNDTVPPTPAVPEPATFALSGAGLLLAGMTAVVRRKKAA